MDKVPASLLTRDVLYSFQHQTGGDRTPGAQVLSDFLIEHTVMPVVPEINPDCVVSELVRRWLLLDCLFGYLDGMTDPSYKLWVRNPTMDLYHEIQIYPGRVLARIVAGIDPVTRHMDWLSYKKSPDALGSHSDDTAISFRARMYIWLDQNQLLPEPVVPKHGPEQTA